MPSRPTMTEGSVHIDTTKNDRRWWRQPEVYLLLLVGMALYGSRLTSLTIRGEESRRARVAQEMIDSGDWVVERQQGELFADRPPLGEWAIVVATLLNGGEMTTATIRLPAVLATILTGFMIFFCCRPWFSRIGAFAAGLVYLTFGQVMQIGRLAESEAIFVLLLGSAMLVWHTGYLARWRPWLTWSCGYTLAALAGLTKGPQGPVYFCAAIGLYLLVQRDWRFLFSWSHGFGLGIFAAIFLSWLVPYYLRTDARAVRDALCGVSVVRFGGTTPLWQHVLSYPVQIFVCLMPWSPLLLRLWDRKFWNVLGSTRPHVVFGLTAVVATVPSVLFASEALNRHFLGLAPCFAVLCGTVINGCLTAEIGSRWRRLWNWYLAGIGCVMVGAIVCVCGAKWLPGETAERIVQANPHVAIYGVGAMVALAGIVWSIRSYHPRTAMIGLLTAALFFGGTYSGPTINVLAMISENQAEAIAELKERLPTNVKLVSFGRLDHVFTFHYRESIPVVPWPTAVNSLSSDTDFFCYTPSPWQPKELPFTWEQIAIVSCDRNHLEQPQRAVIVGRRTGPPQVAQK